MGKQSDNLAINRDALENDLKRRKASGITKIDDQTLITLNKLIFLRSMICRTLTSMRDHPEFPDLEQNYEYVQNQIKLLLAL
jgi:hypothetical protein